MHHISLSIARSTTRIAETLYEMIYIFIWEVVRESYLSYLRSYGRFLVEVVKMPQSGDENDWKSPLWILMNLEKVRVILVL